MFTAVYEFSVVPMLDAACVVCGEVRPVCCDSGTHDDGTHDDPVCRECCGPHHAARTFPTYERCDCDN